MYYEHTWVGGVLRDDVCEKLGSLLSRRPGAKALGYGVYVVVDRLWHAHHVEIVAVLFKERREIGSGGISVVAPDGMQHIDLVLDELVCSYLLRILPFLDEPAFDAVFYVCKFNAAVADRRSSEFIELVCVLAELGANGDAGAFQQPFITTDVTDYFNFGRNLGVTLDERRDCGTQAWREPAGCENCNFFNICCHYNSSLND